MPDTVEEQFPLGQPEVSILIEQLEVLRVRAENEAQIARERAKAQQLFLDNILIPEVASRDEVEDCDTKEPN